METRSFRDDQVCLTRKKDMETCLVKNNDQEKYNDQLYMDTCLTRKKDMEISQVKNNDQEKHNHQVYMDTCLTRKKGMESCLVKYILLMSILWSVILGLGSGFLLAIIEGNGGQRYKAECILTLVHFLVCFSLICQPANKSLVRVWLLIGLVWILGMVISYNRMDWTERNQEWWIALLSGSISWMVTVGLPLNLIVILKKCL